MIDPTPPSNLELNDHCPISGLPIEFHPDWEHVSLDGAYGQRFTLIGRRILHSQPWGVAHIDEVRWVLDKMQQVMNERLPTGETYVHISDLSRVTNTTAEIRKKYIQHFQSNLRLAGVLYYGVSTFYHLSINLGAKLNLIPFQVEIVGSYDEAIQRAMKLLAIPPAVDLAAGRPPAPISPRHPEPVSSQALPMEWRIDNACTVFFDRPEPAIFRMALRGVLEERHIQPLFSQQELAFTQLGFKDHAYAMVWDLTHLKSVTLKARRLLFDHLKQWNLHHPLHIHVFQGVRPAIRAAILIARPFSTFKTAIAATFQDAQRLIYHQMGLGEPEMADAHGPLADGQVSGDAALATYVEQLLGFLGHVDRKSVV